MIKYTWDDIFAIMESRRDAQSPAIRMMQEIQKRYNADWVLPDLSDEVREAMPNLSPQIIAETIDNYGMRAGSVMPSFTSPAIDPGKQTGKRSRAYAKIRRGILYGLFDENRMELQLRKVYRHIAGYASASMITMPDFNRKTMVINTRDPLCTFPDPIASEDYRDPENIGYVFGKSTDWIIKNYPECEHIVNHHPNADSVMWNMVEWIDCYDTVIGLLGPQEYPARNMSYAREEWKTEDWGKELRRYSNPLGRVPAICPGRVTLDRICSQLGNVLGNVDMMAKLTALDIQAKEKSIYPDKYIIGKNGNVPRLVKGKWYDGRSGEINIIVDADGIGSLNFAGDPAATQSIDRLERNTRVSVGLVPQMGGETYGALRTGRGVDALMGAAVDPKLQEMHVTMETWLRYLNSCALQGLKEYWPTKQFTMPGGKFRDEVRFTPGEHIETFNNTADYAIAGADAQGLTVMLGQLLGMKAMSKRTFMERHPLIGDADAEMSRIDEEMLEETAMQAVMQGIGSGSIPPIFIAFMEEARREDPEGDIITAIQAANRKMQEMQAQEAPAPEEGQIAAPETQPGMTGPAQQPAAPQPGMESPGDLNQLRQLMNALGQTTGVVSRA